MNKKKWLLLAWIAAVSVPAFPQDGDSRGWWLGAGLGMGSVKSSAPAPSAGRDALAASVDLGYRFTPQWGLGFEYGGLIPVDGCADWPCGDTPAAFAPRFTRLMVFSEFRPRDSGWRFRAGVGASRFCQSRHWSATAWSIGDTLGLLLTAALDDDLADETVSGSGSWRCDAHMKALGGMVSVGYDWPIAREHPVSLGLRLSAEAADFGPTRAIGLPAFQHRALMLSLHVSIN